MSLEMDLHRDNHTLHLHQQHHAHHPTPPPPPLPTHRPSAEADEDTKPRPFLPFSLPNGTLKKHRQEPPQPQPQPPHPPPPPPPPLPWSRRHGHERRKNHVVYRECMKNHAAPLGGHALDGCGEFMPSPASNPSEPASLTCAACGCHRNFHRRLLHSVKGEEGGLEEADGDEEGRSPSPPPRRHVPGFNQYCSSAPHMLMALSAGLHGGTVAPDGSPPVARGTAPAATVGGGTPTGEVGRTLPVKRFRTKFSPEQKAGMQELCERLGWRMQRRDDALVEQRCKEMGVSRGVFKVWMHNNKHAFVGGASSRRGGGGGGAGETTSYGGGDHGGGGGVGCGVGGGGGAGGVCVRGENGNGSGAGLPVNTSSVSS